MALSLSLYIYTCTYTCMDIYIYIYIYIYVFAGSMGSTYSFGLAVLIWFLDQELTEERALVGRDRP